ncbi:MAG: LamG-like jellyroll fold domain-containing protein, partial [Sediminibacterium sp.]|nr:LamG-like jellyroll fold domain-containing protein [Sediminibacterium sp.]
IPHNTAFVTQKNLSFETWIYPTSSTPAVQNVVSKSSFLVNDGFIFPRTDDGWQNFSFWLAIDGQWKAVTAAFPSLNQWHHVAATYDGFFMKIYLDGILKSSLAVSGNITSNTNDIFIGQQQDQIEYYKGGLDELRIWSRTLTQCEIQNNYTCELNTIGTVTNPNPLASQIGLLAYYQFNQGLANADNSAVTTSAISTTAINVLTDISGSGNHGSLHNFDLTGTSSNWMVGGTVNGNTCSAFTASTASVTSNAAIVAVGSPITMSVNGGTAWSWTGPGSPAFTSNQQAINIANAQPVNSGIYTVSVTGSGGCIEDISTSVKVANRAGTLHFDGNNDLVTVPSNASLNIPNTITIESWIYPTDDIRQTQDVMGKSSYDINTGYIFPRTDDGWKSFVFYLHINGAWQKLSAIFPNPALNKWNHLSATYDGFFMRIYLDGVLQASKQVSGNITQNINNLMIGQQPGYNEYFSGQLDEARIWNRALSQCEIINNMGCELANSTVARNGLVAYYQFNQGFIAENNANENTLIDASGNNNTGSLQNFTLSGTASNWSTEYIKGICAAYSDPGVSASANGSILGIGSTVKLFTNHLVIPSSYSWDGPQGTGFSTIKNPTIINAQTSATGIYTVTANYVNCSVMASTKVSVNALSPIEANGPTTFCPSGSVSLLTPNPGIGYQWYLNDGINGDVMIAGATANTYVAGQSGNYWVTVNNGQNILVSVPITVLVIDNQAPQPVIAQLLPMTLQLPGNNLPAIVSLYPTATDNCRGTITGTTTDALSFTTPGTYSILWKYDDQNGQIVTQLQQIHVLKPIDVTPPVLTLPGNIIVPAVLTSCGATVYFTATATDDSGDPVTIAYSLAPGSLFSVGNTTVTVTATDLSSNAATGTFTVAVLPTVVSPVSGNNIICVGAATILTTTTTTGGTWSSNNMAVASVDQSGNVIGLLAGTADIRYTNSCGVFASIPVTVNAIPSVPIVSVTDNCGTSALTASGVTGTLLWSNGGTTPGITVPAGTYTVTQTVNGCVSPSGSGTANPKAIPSAPIVSVTDNCGTSALTASGVTGTLLWSNGGITPSITVPSGTYTVTQTVNGCVSPSGTGTAVSLAIPSTPVITVVNGCGFSTLTASNTTGSLSWSNGSTGTSITVTNAGSYSVTQTVGTCISTAATAIASPIQIPSAPSIVVADNCGTSTLTATGANGASFKWNDIANSTTATITVPVAGTYMVTQTVATCISAAAFGIASPKAVPVTPTITVVNSCGSTLVSTDATGSILWSNNGGTLSSFTATAPGTYTVTSTNANGCSATSGTTSVTINSIPVVAPITGNVSVTTGYTSQLANATAGGVWSSSNSAIASVNASGLVTGVTAGTTDIIYTVTNSTCTTAVTTLITVTFQPICSVLPMATITPSTADVLCNKVTLNGSSSVAGSSYSWMFGTNSLGSNPFLKLDLTSADGTYRLYVTANGCTSLAASYQYQKQNLVNSYTILAFKEIKLGKNNTVVTGSLGVTSTKGVIKLNSNTSIASAGSFVKASAIKKEGSGINIGNPIYSAATGIILPTMYNNTVNANSLSGSITVNQNSTSVLTGNYKSLTLKKGSVTTLKGTKFGSIKMEEGAEVIFTASSINIDKLDVQNGPDKGYTYIRFVQQAKVLVSSGVNIGSKVFMNPDNQNVTFYLGDNSPDKEMFTVNGRHTKVNANIYIPNGELKVNGGYGESDDDDHNGDNHGCDDDDHDGNHEGNHDDDDHHENQDNHGNGHVYMTGFFIAEKVEAEGKNIIWNSFKCDAASAYSPNSFTVNTVNQTVSQEKMVNIASTEEELKITVMPNPSTTYFTLKFESKYQAPVNLRVMDVNGRVVDAKSKISPNSTIQIGAGYTSGNYFAEMMQGTQRKVIQLIKVRG